MLNYIIRRILIIIPMMIAISIVSFAIIKLPPGDYLSSHIQQMRLSGQEIDQSQIRLLEKRYGLDQPAYMQYLKWISGFPKGDFGMSFRSNKPVWTEIKSRIGFTIVISLLSLILSWVIAIPVGIYSAVRQYSVVDYVATVIGFIGLAIPSFLLALVLRFVAFKLFGISVTGLFSPQYMGEPWTWAKFVNMLGHIWIPVVIVGTSGTAGAIRVMRAQMLDELGQLYVQTARSKGLPERVVILKHALKLAINPMISTVGWILPGLIGGEVIVSVVLQLPTMGPLLLDSLLSQDMYLAGTILMMLSFLTVVGTLISDILLAIIDPRIRYE